uniref:Uncharacterized protein n=1 Tax=Tanacetum cinerariifolium TaxID=118510 RepID=A0A699HEL9_TANCI|nr:hypothetical protein [Tanacetum cinerariifolium]
MSSYNHFGYSWCRGPFNGGNCPGCSSVGSGNEFVYDPNTYSYNETPNFFNQPLQHLYETYSCELCGDSPHYGFDCQTRPPLVYKQDPCNNQIFSNDQSPYCSPSQPQQFDCCEEMLSLRNSNHDPPVDLYYPEGRDDYTKVTYDKEQCLSDRYTALVSSLTYTLSIPFLATIEPADTFLMGDEVTSFYDDLECSMPLDSPPSLRLDVLGERKVDINLPFGEHLDTLLIGDREIDFKPRDIEISDIIPIPWVFDEPLGNSDSVPRSYDVTFSNPLFDFNDDYTICLREVERFDHFFFLTQSGGKTRVMETPFSFHHMSSPHLGPYSPKEVMYCYYHPHLTPGGSMLHGQRPLTLIVSVQQGFSKAKLVTDAAARAETVKWDDRLLLRLKTKLGIRLLE